jgi:membrane fusion protein, multidrug efflux system
MNSKPEKSLSGLLGIGAAALITAGLTLALHTRFAMGEKPAPRIPLTVASVEFQLQSAYMREVSYLGLITAGRKANLGFESAGTIAELPWREGSPVEKGQLIARLDDASLQASYSATSAELEQARTELELAKLKAKRQKDLRESGAVSREAFDETRLRAQALSSRLEAVRPYRYKLIRPASGRPMPALSPTDSCMKVRWSTRERRLCALSKPPEGKPILA